MTCSFGEIVFPSSRAFWGDDDFETTGTELEKKFCLEWISEIPKQINKLIVIESELLIDFAKTCLVKDLEEVCIIKQLDKTCKEPSVAYKKNENLYILVIGKDVDLPRSAEFVEQIQDIIKLTKEIMMLTCDHVSHFKGNIKPDSPSFLKALSTKNAKTLCANDVPHLSQPNIVSGVSSGVISYAEIMEIPAIMYVLYTDTFALDSTSVLPLQKLLSCALDFVIPEYTTSTKGFFSKENLYM